MVWKRALLMGLLGPFAAPPTHPHTLPHFPSLSPSPLSPPLFRGPGSIPHVQPLVLLIFYSVSGGPFGVEPVVAAGGPLVALLGFVFLPLVWSIPEALVTAELSTTFPEAAGCVAWVSALCVGACWWVVTSCFYFWAKCWSV